MTLTWQKIQDFEKKIQETVTGDVAQTTSRITTKKRDIAPSGSNVMNMLLDFISEIGEDSIPETSRETLYNLYSDMIYDSEHERNEGSLKHSKTLAIDKIRTRKWYKKNKQRTKDNAAKLQTKSKKKKREIMAKSGRSLSGKKKKQYHTKDHEKALNEGRFFSFQEYLTENQ